MIFWVVVVKTLWSAFLCAAVQLAKPTWSKEAVLPEEEKSLATRAKLSDPAKPDETSSSCYVNVSFENIQPIETTRSELSSSPLGAINVRCEWMDPPSSCL